MLVNSSSVIFCAHVNIIYVSYKKVAHRPTRLPRVYRVPELIPVLGSQPAGNVSHKPDGKAAVTFRYAYSYPRSL